MSAVTAIVEWPSKERSTDKESIGGVVQPVDAGVVRAELRVITLITTEHKVRRDASGPLRRPSAVGLQPVGGPGSGSLVMRFKKGSSENVVRCWCVGSSGRPIATGKDSVTDTDRRSGIPDRVR